VLGSSEKDFSPDGHISFVSTDLRAQAKQIVTELLTAIHQKMPAHFPTRYVRYTRYVPETIEYDQHHIATNIRWKGEDTLVPEHPERTSWIREFVEKTIEAHAAVNKLSELFGPQPEVVKNTVDAFLVREGETPADNAIEILLDDLEGKPPLWRVSAMMYGVAPSTESITLVEGIELRKVRKEDLVLGGYSPFSVQLSFPNPHSILEFSTAGFPHEVQDKVGAISIVLTLFRETPANVFSYDMRPKSFLQFGGTLSRQRGLSDRPMVMLDPDDARHLRNLFKLIGTKIPKAVLRNEPIDPLEMGLKRYLDSLRSNVLPEEKLTYAIMGTEALLLEGETELKFRLQSRLARLLGSLNESPQTVFVDLSEAYELRSSYVHGASLTPQERSKCDEMLTRLWRYLRKTILFMMLHEITSDGKKKQFLKQLDFALVDQEKAQAVADQCRQVLSLAEGAFLAS